ncbi:MAG TPA: aminoglycoside phosphotransferase family protein [Pyrinomonadaceae bacterium]|jgi:streptomycin 6-kinase
MTSLPQFNSLPEKLVTNLRNTFGAAGEALLRELPRIVAESAARWDLTLAAHFPNLSFNYVVPGRRRDGTQIVLKIGVPDNKELLTELAALRVFNGRRMARLLDAFVPDGVLLLERIRPGTSLLHEPDDARATRIAAETMRDYWPGVPAAHSFPSAAKWCEAFQRLRRRFDGDTGPLPAALVARAEELAAELLASAQTAVLLHGDLHQDNILAAGGAGWMTIDPKGVVGEPCYEVGAFLRNPLDLFNDAERARATSARRLDIFAEVLGFDRARMARWALVQTVLSACWSLEDGEGDWAGALSCAETFARLS